MSREIGLSNGAYSQWNTEKTNPSKKTLLKVAEYLGVPVETLTAEDAEKKKSLLKPAGLIITICLMTRTGRFFRNGYIITQINNFYNSSLCCFVNGKDFFHHMRIRTRVYGVQRVHEIINDSPHLYTIAAGHRLQ